MSEHNHLLRVLGVAFGIAAVIGGTIGQGILRSPGAVAAGVSDATLMLFLWLVVGTAIAIDAMSTVELASSIRKTGGPYIFTSRAFGRFAGLAVGLTDWLGNIAAIGFVSVVCAEYLHRMGVATDVSLGILAAALPVVLGIIQLFGTKVAGRSQELGSAIKTILLVVLVLGLLLAPRGAPVVYPAAPVAITLLGMIAALRAIVGTYNGWNTAAYFCEEVTDPARSIKRATFTGIGIVTTLYLLVNVALLSQLSPAEMAGDKLVAATAAARLVGPRADFYVTAISLVSLVTITNMLIMQMARVAFAIARDAAVPVLDRVAENGSPNAAIVASAGIGALLATIGVYETLLALSTSLVVGVNVVVNLAAIRMRQREPDLDRPYRMPLFPLPALFSFTVNGALLAAFVYEDPGSASTGFVLMLGLSAITYVAIRWNRARLLAA